MTMTLERSTTVRDQVSPEEWAARVELAAAYRLVSLYGWDDLIFTHLSARVPGPEHHFLINDFTLMFEEVTASNLIRIDMNGEKVGDQPGLVNRAGFVIHSAIHGARDDARAVIHLHTPQGQAVSAMKEGLLPHSQTAMIAHHDVAYHDHEGIADALEERDRIVADMGEKNALILRNHGTLTVGRSVAEAFLRMYFLERACEAQVLMMAAGRDGLNDPTRDAIDTVTAQVRSPQSRMVAEQIAWPALLRKLDRTDPTYRQ